MRTKIFLILTSAISIFGCDTRPKFVQDLEKNRDVYQLRWTMTEFGRLADTTFTDSTDLKSILDFKTIDVKGAVKSVDMETAIKLYNSNIENKKPELYPIFEIKNTSRVILPVFGQGLWDKIWGKVVLDKNSMKVIDMEFDHKSETPGIGANIKDSIFTNQFIGSKIYLNENTYTLFQEDNMKIDGKQWIDGISGATITSEGAIQMLNKDLVKYEKYLR